MRRWRGSPEQHAVADRRGGEDQGSRGAGAVPTALKAFDPMSTDKMLLRSEATLTDEDLRAIGCVAVESTYLDDLLDLAIQRLCRLNEHDFRVLAAGAQSTAKCNMVRDVTGLRIKPEVAARHKQLFEDINALIRQRNDIIHGSWSVHLRGVPKSDASDDSFDWVREGDPVAFRTNRGKTDHRVFRQKDLLETARGLARVHHALLSFLGESDLLRPRSAKNQ